VPGKNKNPKWHTTPRFANDRVGLMLTVCHHWLGKVSPTTQWKARLFALFDEYPKSRLPKWGFRPIGGPTNSGSETVLHASPNFLSSMLDTDTKRRIDTAATFSSAKSPTRNPRSSRSPSR